MHNARNKWWRLGGATIDFELSEHLGTVCIAPSAILRIRPRRLADGRPSMGKGIISPRTGGGRAARPVR